MDAVLAVVQTWDDDEGLGVCSAAELPGGCWVHFSSVEVPGLRRLTAGDTVRLVAETVEQDGYAFRAIRCWLPGRAAEDPGGPTAQDHSGAYTSSLGLSFDADEPPSSQ